MKYDQMADIHNVIAKQVARITVDVPGPGGRGWRRTNSSLDTQDEPDLDKTWREDMATGSRYMLAETWVKSNEPHYALPLV